MGTCVLYRCFACSHSSLGFCDKILQVVNEEFGIVEGLMTTVHATTGIQSLCASNSFHYT